MASARGRNLGVALVVLTLLSACSRTLDGLKDDASGLWSGKEGSTAASAPLPKGDPRILEIQVLLNEMGYPAGPADGISGPKTAAAIRTYQTDHGMRVTGKPSAELLDDLMSSRAAMANER